SRADVRMPSQDWISLCGPHGRPRGSRDHGRPGLSWSFEREVRGRVPEGVRFPRLAEQGHQRGFRQTGRVDGFRDYPRRVPSAARISRTLGPWWSYMSKITETPK